MKRIFLFVVTNLAILVVLSITARILGIDRILTANGLNLGALLMFAALFGFDGSEGSTEYWLVATVKKLADKAGVGMPEVAIFEGAPNAFATGAFKNSALVAVSTGLLQTMNRDEVEAVLGHEMAHVANGDMVTLTLIQGVVNTFVIFLSRVIGYIVDKAIFRTERGVGPGFFIASLVSQILLGILASMIVAWFSRQREFRADAGSAHLMGDKRPMINALARLGGVQSGELPQAFEAHGIKQSQSRFLGLFASHPPIEERIRALQAA
jgi:heat shock protein HtpX